MGDGEGLHLAARAAPTCKHDRQLSRPDAFCVSGLPASVSASESAPPPFCMRRGAEVQTDQGERLFEPKASSSSTPAGPSTAGCPERSAGTQTAGSPFSLLTFFLA